MFGARGGSPSYIPSVCRSKHSDNTHSKETGGKRGGNREKHRKRETVKIAGKADQVNFAPPRGAAGKLLKLHTHQTQHFPQKNTNKQKVQCTIKSIFFKPNTHSQVIEERGWAILEGLLLEFLQNYGFFHNKLLHRIKYGKGSLLNTLEAQKFPEYI